MQIPEGTVLARAKREGWTQQIEVAKRANALVELTHAGRMSCYDALKPDGRFASQVRETHGLLSWKA
jgi:hypothetical protein